MIPVVFAINEKYGFPCYLAIYSLEQVMNPQDDYQIIILYEKLSQGIINKISELKSEKVAIQFLCVSQYLQKEMYRKGDTTKTYITKETYFRLLIPSLLSYDKVIYMDSDILIMRDLRELYDVDINNFLLGACVDVERPMNPFTGGMWESYTNAGILLMNCEALRKEELFEKSMELLRLYPKLESQDQDVLNFLCQNRIKILNPVWNRMVWLNTGRIEEKCILHFIGGRKPWNAGNSDAYAIYYEMVKRAGETDWFFKQMTFQKRVESVKEKMLYIAEDCYQNNKVSAKNLSTRERKIIKMPLIAKYMVTHPRVFTKSAIILKELVLYLPLVCAELKQLLRTIDYVEKVIIYAEEYDKFSDGEQLMKLLWESRKMGEIRFVQKADEGVEKRQMPSLEEEKSVQDLMVQCYYCNKDTTVFSNGRWFFCQKQYLDFSKAVSRRKMRTEIYQLQEQRYSNLCRSCTKGTVAYIDYFRRCVSKKSGE